MKHLDEMIRLIKAIEICNDILEQEEGVELKGSYYDAMKRTKDYFYAKLQHLEQESLNEIPVIEIETFKGE